MTLSPKENYLQAIRFGKPDYVPRAGEDIFFNLQVQDNMSRSEFTDEWQVKWVQKLPGTAPFPTHNPLSDLDLLQDYSFPDPDLLFDPLWRKKESIRAAKASGKIVIGNYVYFLYERVWALMGMENFLIALVEQPKEVQSLLQRIAMFSRKVFENYLELGVEAIGFSEDLGTQKALMFSPDLFRKHFLPQYEIAFAPVLSAGAILNFHSCGRIDEIAADLAAIGVTILNPLQARANDLVRVKKETHGKMALQGAIDSHLLLTGTPQQVAAETRRILQILKPGGGYVLAPDQGFPEYPKGNLEAMDQVAREQGRYDGP